MKRIKRAVAVLLAVMMVFSVIGCGGSSGSKKSDSSSKETKDAKTEEVWGDKSGQDEICGDPDGKYTIGVVIHTTTDMWCTTTLPAARTWPPSPCGCPFPRWQSPCWPMPVFCSPTAPMWSTLPPPPSSLPGSSGCAAGPGCPFPGGVSPP